MRQFYYDLFRDWEIAIAKKLVNDYVQQWQCLRRGDFEVILWECLSHWYMVKGSYNADMKASKRTYMGRVLRNKLQDIVRRETTDLREIWLYTVSLEKKMGNDEDSPPYSINSIWNLLKMRLTILLKISTNKLMSTRSWENSIHGRNNFASC